MSSAWFPRHSGSPNERKFRWHRRATRESWNAHRSVLCLECGIRPCARVPGITRQSVRRSEAGRGACAAELPERRSHRPPPAMRLGPREHEMDDDHRCGRQCAAGFAGVRGIGGNVYASDTTPIPRQRSGGLAENRRLSSIVSRRLEPSVLNRCQPVADRQSAVVGRYCPGVAIFCTASMSI